MRNKGGRPPLDEGKRSFKIDVRFTKQELVQVEALAKDLGLNKTDLVRRRLLGETEGLMVNAAALMRALDLAGLELARSGNNINQLARYANRLQKHGVLSPGIAHEYKELLALHNRQQQDLQKLFRKLLRSANP